MQHWSIASWRQKVDYQPMTYPEEQMAHYRLVLRRLAQAPPMISPSSVMRLRAELARVATGQSIVLHGGDCAEQFVDLAPETIAKQAKFLRDMAEQLAVQMGRPVTCIGRMAGQFAKPRSQLTHQEAGRTLPSYRGDLLNAVSANPLARQFDPARLWQGYELAAQAVEHLLPMPGLPYFSHEALHLDYETALTRLVGEQYYNLATHLPWVGMRTCALDSAHVEYVRGLANPVAVKISAAVDEEALLGLVARLNPLALPGKLLLIYRLGEAAVADALPRLLRCSLAHRLPVLWLCDPMHGNTVRTPLGLKTRPCDTMLAELSKAIAIHHRFAVPLHGVHLEMTHRHVHECVDSKQDLIESRWQPNYHSVVDPRLNPEQARRMLAEVVPAWQGRVALSNA